MVEVGIKIKVSSDFGDPKVARESRGSTDRKNHSSEKTKKIKYVTKYTGLYRTEAFSVRFGHITGIYTDTKLPAIYFVCSSYV